MPSTETTSTTRPQTSSATNEVLPKPESVPIEALNAKEYLERTVVPAISQGLKQLVHERPEDPFEFMALYLMEYSKNIKK